MFLRNMLLLLFIIVNTPVVYPQLFSTDRVLDTTALNLWDQPDGDIAVSNDGMLGITWVDFVYDPYAEHTLYFAKSTDHGKTFIKTVLDSIASVFYDYDIFLPKLHFDKTGNIWIAENSSEEYIRSSKILKSTDGGTSFVRFPLSYSPYGDGSTCYSITSDSIDNVFILAAQTSFSSIRKMKVLKFIEGNLIDTVSTFIDTAPQENIYFPGIAADKDGKNIYLVFQKNITNGKLYFARSGDGGLSFSIPAQLDAAILNQVSQHSPAITMWNNKVVITWSDNRSGDYHLYYTESADSGSTFSLPVRVSNESAAVSMLTGNNGMLNILWGSYYYPDNIYYTNKFTGNDTFAIAIKPGDPAFHNSHKSPLGIAADHEGYTYILFQDDRFIDPPYGIRIFLTTELFTLTRSDDELNTPADYHLFQNYPNPFNASTTIRYSLPHKRRVTLRIYDLLGREILKLIDEEKPAGVYEITWNASPYPSGVYFLRMNAGKFSETRKVVMVK
jgi:hypothetical protein